MKVNIPVFIEEKTAKTKRMFEYWAIKNHFNLEKNGKIPIENNYKRNKTRIAFAAFCAGENFARGKDF